LTILNIKEDENWKFSIFLEAGNAVSIWKLDTGKAFSWWQPHL